MLRFRLGGGGGGFVEFTKDKRFKLRLSDWSCDPARTVQIQSPFEVCHELGSLSHGDGWTLRWTLGLQGSLHEVNRRGTVRGTRNFKNRGCNNSQNNKRCPLVLFYIFYFQSAKMLHLFFFFFLRLNTSANTKRLNKKNTDNSLLCNTVYSELKKYIYI